MNENNPVGGFPNGNQGNADAVNGENVVSRQQTFYRSPQSDMNTTAPLTPPMGDIPAEPQPVIRRGDQRRAFDQFAGNDQAAYDALSDMPEDNLDLFKEPEEEFDEPEQEIKERRSYKRRRRVESRASGCLKSLLYSVIVLTVSLIVGFYVLSVAFDFIGVARPADESSVQFVISEGDTVEDIAQNLKKEDIITRPAVFQLFMKYIKDDVVFTPGVYTVKTNADYNSLVHQLQYTAKSSDTVRLTFPEGFTIDDIAELLEEEGVCTKSDLIEVIETGDFSDYDFIADLDNLEDRYYRLEGYMYPDTYDFFQNESPKSIINKFLNNFENKMTDALKDRAAELDMTIDDVVTLASIIQKEAPDFDNMCGVSSVFHNRLDSSDMRYLQTDTTTNYPSSKYDTYQNPGLPPGAICSPGIEALEAALYPSESNYLYFASDENGKFYYGRTYAEHQKNWDEIQTVNGEE